MKCTVPGTNVKIVGRALHSLAKIGDDLYIDPQIDGLSLRTINSSRSAFASYFFRPPFFAAFQRSDDPDTKCKISMKGVLMVFRSISVLEKTVESCSLDVMPEESKLQIQFRCKHSVVKTFNLPFIECESLKAAYDNEDTSNRFTAQSKVLTDAVLNFLTKQEEVTMTITKGQFSMKNFVEDIEARKSVHTELTMQPSEFEEFEIGLETAVTFCLKELRAIISFADSLALPVTACLTEGGHPIVFSTSSPPLFEGALVMATLSDTGEEVPNQQREISRTEEGRLHPATPTVLPRQSTQRSSAPSPRPPSLTPIRPVSLAPSTPNLTPNRTISQSMDIGNNGDAEEIPPSPPAKKAKFFFQRCFDATFNPKNVPGNDRILAPDSDEES